MIIIVNFKKMKKTRILSVLALASMMAACSNEEIVVSEKVQQDLSVRPVVENSTIADANESRMAITGAYRPQFEDGDKIGAVLIDEPTYATKTAYNTSKTNGIASISLYNIVNGLGSNYPYERVEGAWYTQAELVEGNYMFYAPYNAANSSVRFNPVVKVPAKQTVTSQTSAIEEFAASGEIVKVGYAFMDAEGSMKPSVAMQDVFAYPLITLKNSFKGYLFGERVAGAMTPVLYEGDIKVDSIQITTGSSVVVEAALQYGDNLNYPATSQATGIVGELRNVNGANTNDWYVNWANAYTGDILSTNEVKSRTTITTLVLNKTLAKGDVETFNVVLPAKAYGQNLKAKVFVTIGTKQYEICSNVALDNTAWDATNKKLNFTSAAAYSKNFTSVATSGVTLVKAQQYPVEVYNTNGTLKEGADALMTIDLVGGELTGYATATQASQITGTSVAQAAFEYDPATPAATGISNNAELINWFKNTVRNTNLTEVADAGNVTKKTQFNLLAENTVTINAELIDALAAHNVTGSIQFTSLLPIAKDVMISDATVNQSGTEAIVTFQSVASENTFMVLIPVQNAPANITANGNYVMGNTAINIVNSGDDTDPLTNVNIINVAGIAASIDLDAIKDAAYISTLNNLGTLTLTSGMDAGQLVVYNNGTMTNTLKTNAKIYNYGTLTNNGTLMTACYNDGTITTGTSSITKIDGGEGDVNNQNLATVNVSAGSQTVYYTHTGNFTSRNTQIAATTGINKLIVTGNYAPATNWTFTSPLKNCSVNTIQVGGSAVDVSLYSTIDMSAVKFIFGQDVTITGAATGTTLTGCTFYSDDNITLNNVNATGNYYHITTGGTGEVHEGEWSTWN